MPRVARQARNQALFRAVNERIADIAGGFDAPAETQAFVCECSRPGCTETVQLPPGAYARIRENPTTFLVLAGHQDPERVQVVERASSYLIVRHKPGVAADTSRETTLSKHPEDARAARPQSDALDSPGEGLSEPR